MITVSNIKPKDRIYKGQVIVRRLDGCFNADIEPGKWIRIYGAYNNARPGEQEFDRLFEVGDVVEYDSYNNSYTGPIVAIGRSTVTIDKDRSSKQIARLSLYEFIWRNYDLDLERIARKWAEWMD